GLEPASKTLSSSLFSPSARAARRLTDARKAQPSGISADRELHPTAHFALRYWRLLRRSCLAGARSASCPRYFIIDVVQIDVSRAPVAR
ncbi:hypothetical protein, partial [Bradyrhizobium canariense]|uniref:hypothetical protein n=1 Tax=Bradyrhizobium canariense TaxID=255045 RepID=UPI001A7E15B0